MNVVAVIVEQLEADGRLKRLTMNRGSANQLEVAFPEEFVGERSGPFFFPNEHDEELFKKDFADCRVLKLSKQSFTTANGEYTLRMHRGGIGPTFCKSSVCKLACRLIISSGECPSTFCKRKTEPPFRK